MKISNISFGLKKVFFQLLCILNLYSSIIASSAAEPPTLLEGYEITHRDDLFGKLAPKDNKPFTNENWEELITTKFEVTLQKIGDDSLVVVDAQVYEEEFLKQFTKEDLIDESNAISIFYPCKITLRNNASDLHNKYVLLFEYPRDYILPSEVMLDAEPDQIVKRNIKGHNYRPQYNSHKVIITSAEPCFFKMVKPHQTVEKKLSQYLYQESNVDSKLYRDCAYYNFYSVGDAPQIKRKFEVTDVAFKNGVPTEKLLVKSDNKHWLGAVITETMVPAGEKNANKHYADFILKTPFEVSENDVKKMVGSLPPDKENYTYLKLFYTQGQQTYKIECYPKGSTKCNAVHGVLKSPDFHFPSTVTLDLGDNPRDTWKSYVDGFPILNEALRKKFSSSNGSNMIAMMNHALNQNNTIRKVRILTNCLTPSMYRTFRSWDSGPRKVTIWPKSGKIIVFSSSEKNFFPIMTPDEVDITAILTKYLDNVPSQRPKELEESYKNSLVLQDYDLGESVPFAIGSIYSKLAAIRYKDKFTICQHSAPTLHDQYLTWLCKAKKKAIGTVETSKSEFKINIKNERILEAIFYESLGNKNQLSIYKNHINEIELEVEDSKFGPVTTILTVGGGICGAIIGGPGAGLLCGATIGVLVHNLANKLESDDPEREKIKLNFLREIDELSY